MKLRTWVFGGTGFIGSPLVRELRADPRYDLHLLLHKFRQMRDLETVHTFSGSLENFDLKWWDRFPPQVFFHLARIAGDSPSARTKAAVRGSKANQRLINYLEKLAAPPVCLYVSGSLMYGNLPSGERADEESPIRPVAYGAYYLEGERPWMEARERGQLDVRMLRPGWITGPDSWFRYFYWEHMRRFGEVPLFGDPAREMSLIHVEDGAALMAHWQRVGSFGQGLNLFCGQPVSQEEFCTILSRRWGVPLKRHEDSHIQKLYGQTEWEALSSNTPLTTLHPEAYNGFVFRYPDPEAILNAVCGALENE